MSELKRIFFFSAVVALGIAGLWGYGQWDKTRIPEEPDLPGDFFVPKAFNFAATWKPGAPGVGFPDAVDFLTQPEVAFLATLDKVAERPGGAHVTVTPKAVIKSPAGLPPQLEIDVPASASKNVDLPSLEGKAVLVRLGHDRKEGLWTPLREDAIVPLTYDLAQTAFFVKRQWPADPLKDVTLNFLLMEQRWDKNAGRDVLVALFNETSGMQIGAHLEVVVTEDSSLDGEIIGLPVVLTRFRNLPEQRGLACPSYGSWRLAKLLDGPIGGLPQGAAARTLEGRGTLLRLAWMRQALKACIHLPNEEVAALKQYRAERKARLEAGNGSPFEVAKAVQDAEKARATQTPPAKPQ